MSIAFVPSPENPTRLSPRYEVRQLTRQHFDWATAIVVHSNVFHSPVWSLAYPEGQVKRCHDMVEAAAYLVYHQLDSGMSFGVFDLDYKFKRPESEATGGKLYWDPNEIDADGATLLEQMDFPLCSVALAYDGINELEMPKVMPLIEILPLFGTVYAELDTADKREPASWKPKGPRQVLMRNATSTKKDYEGEGLMKGLAQWLMRQAHLNGYSGIQIECAHDAVTHVWKNAPDPFDGELISKFDMGTYTQQTEEGKVFHPFRDSKQVSAKVFVTLNHDPNQKMSSDGVTAPSAGVLG